jgi:hypothetical protein
MSNLINRLASRWSQTAREPVSWEPRNMIVASLVPPGHRVLDLGAGNRNLQPKLHPSCGYVPRDRVEVLPGTTLCDFNQDVFPVFPDRFDTVVLSGVSEYIIDPEHLFRQLHAYGDRVIVTYAFAAEQPDYKKRYGNDWVNHLTRAQFEALLSRAGWHHTFVTYWKQQGIYLLRRSDAFAATPSIINIHRLDPSNIGDFFCNPSQYFPLGDIRTDLRQFTPSKLHSNVIVGGGGLLHESFYTELKALRTKRALIYWGVGENNLIDVKERYHAFAPVHVPEDLRRNATLIGLRDHSSGFPWAPCPSCMHPLMDMRPEKTQEIGFFMHKRVDLNPGKLPVMSNDNMNMFQVLHFMGSCETVVTNSYHGVYWATLLGCKVVCVPFGSKFYHFKHPPAFARPEKWEEAIASARAYPEALEECRLATVDFHALCMNALVP